MDDDDWRLLSWIKRSKNRRNVVKHLHRVDEPRTATELQEYIDTSTTHIARALRQLAEKDPAVAICINPDSPYGRRYRLTDKGEEIAKKLRELQGE